MFNLLKKWGKWTDLSAGFFDEHYLLQARRSKDGMVEFRVIKSAEGKEVKKGECLNADIALLGCHLLRMGIVREEKEKIKELVADIVLAQLTNQKETLLERIEAITVNEHHLVKAGEIKKIIKKI